MYLFTKKLCLQLTLILSLQCLQIYKICENLIYNVYKKCKEIIIIVHVQLHSCWFGITLLQHTPRYWNNDNK